MTFSVEEVDVFPVLFCSTQSILVLNNISMRFDLFRLIYRHSSGASSNFSCFRCYSSAFRSYSSDFEFISVIFSFYLLSVTLKGFFLETGMF